MRITEGYPDPARSDAGLILSSEWAVGSPDRLVATADAVIAAWAGLSWPDGLLSCSLFLDADGDGDLIRHYSQWTTGAAFADFHRIDAAVADAHREALAATGRGISQGPLWDKVQTMPGVRPRASPATASTGR